MGIIPYLHYMQIYWRIRLNRAMEFNRAQDKSGLYVVATEPSGGHYADSE